MNVGTVNILFDRPTSLLVVNTCTTKTRVKLKLKYLVHRKLVGSSINSLFCTVQTCPFAQLVHHATAFYIPGSTEGNVAS